MPSDLQPRTWRFEMERGCEGFTAVLCRPGVGVVRGWGPDEPSAIRAALAKLEALH